MRAPAALRPRVLTVALVLAALAAVLPASLAAQPFGAWLTLPGAPTTSFIEIPHSTALNPTGALTIEAWVDISISNSSCNSIAGKGWTQAWWLGICNQAGQQIFRTFVRGYDGSTGSTRLFFDAGIVPAGRWTHVAVVFDGSTRYHYINGELVGMHTESGPPTTSTVPVRIGSDPSYDFSPSGAIYEVRIWNVARSVAQIRSTINVPLTSAQPGLVAVWHLDGNALDPIGGHNGTVHGSANFFTFPVTLSCGSSTATSLCLDGRFAVSARFRVGAPGTAEGVAQTVSCTNPGSGLFWFFSPDNWELMVKAIDGCGLNSRFWIFSAATTNVFYRLEVFDIRAGVNKVYFNYPGPPAPAVTDVNALATCP